MNLWPDGFDTVEKSPLVHLYEQAEKIERRLANIHIIGKREGDVMSFTVAQLFGGGKGELFTIRHPDAYPCTVEWEGGKSRARTEAEFIGLLAKVLNHQKTRLMIADLLKK